MSFVACFQISWEVTQKHVWDDAVLDRISAMGCDASPGNLPLAFRLREELRALNTGTGTLLCGTQRGYVLFQGLSLQQQGLSLPALASKRSQKIVGFRVRLLQSTSC